MEHYYGRGELTFETEYRKLYLLLENIILIMFNIKNKLFMNPNNILKHTKKVKLHLQNVSTIYHLQSQGDGYQLNDNYIFFKVKHLRMLSQLTRAQNY